MRIDDLVLDGMGILGSFGKKRISLLRVMHASDVLRSRLLHVVDGLGKKGQNKRL